MKSKSINKLTIGIIVLAIIVIVIIFLLSGKDENVDINRETKNIIDSKWANNELKDIRTGQNFKIKDFFGKPILLETFAVWCPKCLEQQQEIKKLQEELGDNVFSISLDIDPNEDEVKVKEHIEKNRLNWKFAVLPVEITRNLIEEFSNSINYAPNSPIILICGDGKARQLRNGIKDVNELKSEINKC